MQRRTICVPINSPAWVHYVQEGWVELRVEGMWATLAQP